MLCVFTATLVTVALAHIYLPGCLPSPSTVIAPANTSFQANLQHELIDDDVWTCQSHIVNSHSLYYPLCNAIENIMVIAYECKVNAHSSKHKFIQSNSCFSHENVDDKRGSVSMTFQLKKPINTSVRWQQFHSINENLLDHFMPVLFHWGWTS